MKDIVQTRIMHEIGRKDRDAESVDGSPRLAMGGGGKSFQNVLSSAQMGI